MIVRLDFGREALRTHVVRLAPAPGANVQVVAPLSSRLPFKDKCADEIFLDHALAHTEDFVGIMEECWRVSKRGTLIHIRLPHASSSWVISRDPRHSRHFTLETFNYFDPRFRDPGCGSPASFRVEYARLYLKGARRNGTGSIGGGAVMRMIEGLVNRSRGMQYRWERWFAPMVGGFEEFYVVLSAIKEPPLG